MDLINVDVVSDVVCPWCYLGKARLDQAIANVADDIHVTVNWRPYQLNPDLPPEGVDHKAHLAAKLGGQVAVDRAHQMLTELGQQDGIAFNFDAVKISPNTLDAHRLIRWAADRGSGDAEQGCLACYSRQISNRAAMSAITPFCSTSRRRRVLTAMSSPPCSRRMPTRTL